MRGFEKKRETLIHTAAVRRARLVNKNRRTDSLLFMVKKILVVNESSHHFTSEGGDKRVWIPQVEDKDRQVIFHA
jgi:hypothetical protein